MFHGSEIFSRGYFVGKKFFIVGISWIPNFFLWAFVGSVFSRGYFAGPKFFLVCSKFSLVGNFVTFSCWQHEKRWRRNISETGWVFFSKSISTVMNSIYIRKVLHLLSYLYFYAALVYTNCIFSL